MQIFLKYSCCVLLFSFLWACLGGCSDTSQAVQISTPIPTLEPVTAETSPVPVPTPLSTGAILLKRLPKCEGIQTLDEPVKFNWPNIEQRLKDLEGALWGYYSCPESQEDVASFYRDEMPRTPSIMYYETNWVEREEGSVGVYYDGVNWTYLWIVPQLGNSQKSNVIVAQSNDPVSGDCFLDPPWINHDFAANEISGGTHDLS